MRRFIWYGFLAVWLGPAIAAPLLQQREQSFTLSLNGSVPEVTPLFGPVREAEWAAGWKPQFIHPANGAQQEGAVFTTKSSEGGERLWLLTTYDPNNGRVEYVVIVGGLTANEIKIRVVPDGTNRCRATVTYRHSALGPAGNGDVAKLDNQWAEQQRIHWETAINAALRKPPAQ